MKRRCPRPLDDGAARGGPDGPPREVQHYAHFRASVNRAKAVFGKIESDLDARQCGRRTHWLFSRVAYA